MSETAHFIISMATIIIIAVAVVFFIWKLAD